MAEANSLRHSCLCARQGALTWGACHEQSGSRRVPSATAIDRTSSFLVAVVAVVGVFQVTSEQVDRSLDVAGIHRLVDRMHVSGWDG